MNNKRNSKRSTFQTITKSLKLLIKEKYGKLYVILQFIYAIFQSIIPLVYITVPGLIVNELTTESNKEILLLYVLLLVSCPIINYVLGLTLGTAISKLRMCMIRRYNILFQEHTAEMDYELLEDSDIRVAQQRVSLNAPAPVYMFDRFIPMFIALINIILLFSIIFTLHPLIILLIVVVLVINSLVTKKINKVNFQNKKEISLENNAYYIHYFDLNDSEAAKEIRIFDIKNFFVNLFREKGKKIDYLTLKDEKYRKKMQIFHVLTNVIQQSILYSYLIYSVINKIIAIGTMTIYIAAVEKFSNALNTIFSRYLEISRFCLDVNEYFDFMKLPTSTQKSGTKIPVFDENSIIEFKNVSFKYPRADNYALSNLNITIYGKNKLCIVGANGSGKTTFIKLLIRLYEPTEGEILLNNINIKEYDIKLYQKLFSPVFQDYHLYNLSISSNIVLSNEKEYNTLENVIKKSGLKPLIEKLPNQLETQIWKSIDSDGIEPSGGEGQKIAIARAIYHNSPIYLLDEPTASLDPNAEYDIYCKFNEMINNKTAILITHRLSAVQLADVVAVFEKGNIIEYGTHSKLYELKGVYSKMFDNQAKFYIEKQE